MQRFMLEQNENTSNAQIGVVINNTLETAVDKTTAPEASLDHELNQIMFSSFDVLFGFEPGTIPISGFPIFNPTRWDSLSEEDKGKLEEHFTQEQINNMTK